MQDLFVEARDCIEDARDSHNTNYFDDDLEDAQAGVDEGTPHAHLTQATNYSQSVSHISSSNG